MVGLGVGQTDSSNTADRHELSDTQIHRFCGGVGSRFAFTRRKTSSK